MGSSLSARTHVYFGVIYSASRHQALSSKASSSSNFIVTLERATGTQAGKDEALWQSGVFQAEVLSELSPAKTLGHLLKLYARRAKRAVLGEQLQPPTTVKNQEAWSASSTESDASESVNGGCRYLVRTVPVQTSRLEELGHRLAAAAKGVDSRGEAVDEKRRPADALLLLSGSHPARRLPFLGGLFPDVYDELRLASDMRKRGLLPKGLALWAVANPVTDANEAGVKRVRKKVDLGADVIITQPPLVWEPFERWLRGVTSSGAIGGAAKLDRHWFSSKTPEASRDDGYAGKKRAKLLVGMPVITSPEGLRFWLELCGVSHNRDICQAAYATFRDPLAIDQASTSDSSNGGRNMAVEREAGEDAAPLASPYGQEWFETTLSKLRELEEMGIAGIHVMAPGEAPRRRARELVDEGVFGPRRV